MHREINRDAFGGPVPVLYGRKPLCLFPADLHDRGVCLSPTEFMSEAVNMRMGKLEMGEAADEDSDLEFAAATGRGEKEEGTV